MKRLCRVCTACKRWTAASSRSNSTSISRPPARSSRTSTCVLVVILYSFESALLFAPEVDTNFGTSNYLQVFLQVNTSGEDRMLLRLYCTVVYCSKFTSPIDFVAMTVACVQRSRAARRPNYALSRTP